MLSKFRLLTSSIILPFTFGVVLADTVNYLKNSEFTDPYAVAKVADDFESRPIKYDKKVGDVDVVISLGQQTYPALRDVVEGLASKLDIKVDIQKGSCGSTAKKLLKKSADIATYCCPPSIGDRLPGLEFHTLAISPIALTTNSVNPLQNVSTADARKIFQGEYVSWSEVPGIKDGSNKFTGKKIQPVARMHCKKRPGHWRALLDNQDEFSPRVKSVGTISDMIKQVGDNQTAIGYETPYMLKIHKDKGILKTLSIDGNHPDDLDKLRVAEYPLYRTYSLTTWTGENNKNDKAVKLLDALRDYIEKNAQQYSFIPASDLRTAGWKFRNDELIGEPNGTPVFSEHN